MRMDRRWFPARSCKRDDASGTWPCTRWAERRRDAAAQARDHELREDGRSDRQQARAVARAGQLRHAVFGLRHHRAQLLRHGRDRRCRARPGRRRSQHRAVAARRRAPDVRGHDRDPGPRRVHASAAQPRGRLLRPGADRRDAGARRDAARRGAAARRAGVGGRHARRTARCSRARRPSRRSIRSPSRCRARCSSATPISRRSRWSTARATTTACSSNKNGEVVASWASFAYESGREIAQENRGIPAELLIEMLPLVRDGRALHSLEAELQPVPLASARKLGLPDAWVQRLEQHSPERRQVLSVAAAGRRLAGDAAAALGRSAPRYRRRRS